MTIYFNLNNEGFFYPYLGFFPLFFASCHSIDSVIDVVIKSTNSDAIVAFFAFRAYAKSREAEAVSWVKRFRIRGWDSY